MRSEPIGSTCLYAYTTVQTSLTGSKTDIHYLPNFVRYTTSWPLAKIWILSIGSNYELFLK